jgi:hypothetical protein
MIPVTLTTFLEYSGAGLGIIGWLGVRQIGSITVRQLGFLVWTIGGLILIARGVPHKGPGHHAHQRGERGDGGICACGADLKSEINNGDPWSPAVIPRPGNAGVPTASRVPGSDHHLHHRNGQRRP